MYQMIRRNYYWPSLPASCYETVRSCVACEKERICLQSNSTHLKNLSPSGPLEDIAIDLLGELKLTRRGKKILLVIVDRLTKLVKTVHLRRITAFNIAKTFTAHWKFTYGAKKSVLTENGKQFNAKFLLEMHNILGTKARFTTTYHPKSNYQTERFNRTILESIRRYTADHPYDWDKFSDALTYAYNTQEQTSTGYPPL